MTTPIDPRSLLEWVAALEEAIKPLASKEDLERAQAETLIAIEQVQATPTGRRPGTSAGRWELLSPPALWPWRLSSCCSRRQSRPPEPETIGLSFPPFTRGGRPFCGISPWNDTGPVDALYNASLAWR